MYYFLCAYLGVHLCAYSILNKRLGRSFVIVSNAVFLSLLLLPYFKMSNLSLQDLFLPIVGLGNTFIVLKEITKNDKYWTNINFRMLVCLTFLRSSNLFLNLLALIVLLEALPRERSSKRFELLDYVLGLILIMFSVLVYSWLGNFEFNALKVSIEENIIFLALISFLTFYAVFRLVYELHTKEWTNSFYKKIRAWYWLGIFLTYFLRLSEGIKLQSELIADVQPLILSIIVVLGFLITIKIENLTKFVDKFTYIILFQFFLQIFIMALKLETLVYLEALNLTILLIYLFFDFKTLHHSRTGVNKFLILMIKGIFVLFLILTPFLPLFSIRFLIIEGLLALKSIGILVLVSVIFGMRFRQDLIVLPSIIRQK